MMDMHEAAALLAVCAGFDNRKPDKDTAHVWALALDGIDFEDARQAVIEHYRNEHRWIMPADVVKGVRAIEDARVAAAPNLDQIDPPAEVTMLEGEAFDLAYLRWRKEQARRVRRGLPLQTAEYVAVDDGGRVKELVEAVAQEHRAS